MQTSCPSNPIPQLAEAVGCPGILVMLAQGKETQGLREAVLLISEWIQRVYPPAHGAESIAGAQDAPIASPAVHSVAEELAAELAELSGHAGSKRSREDSSAPADSVPIRSAVLCRAIGIMWFPGASGSGVDPCVVVNALMDELAATKQHHTKFVDRLLPLQRIVRCGMTEVLDAAEALLAPELNPEPLPGGRADGAAPVSLDKPDRLTWSAEIRSRNTDMLSRQLLIGGLGDLMRKRFVVDLVDPSHTLLVEAVMSVAGVSVVRGHAFKRFHKYNVRLVTETDAERDARLHEARMLAERTLLKKAASSGATKTVDVDHSTAYNSGASASISAADVAIAAESKCPPETADSVADAETSIETSVGAADPTSASFSETRCLNSSDAVTSGAMGATAGATAAGVNT
jgi:tRNA(Ser,Leu) C12 N-acetylase TAN1